MTIVILLIGIFNSIGFYFYGDPHGLLGLVGTLCLSLGAWMMIKTKFPFQTPSTNSVLIENKIPDNVKIFAIHLIGWILLFLPTVIILRKYFFPILD